MMIHQVWGSPSFRLTHKMGIYYIRLGISPVNTGGMIYIYIHTYMQEWRVVMFLSDQEVFSTKKMMTPDSSRIIQMVSLNSAYEPLTHEPGCWPWLPLFKTECLATLSETLCKGQRAFSYTSQQDHLEVLRRHRSESLILLSWKHYGYFTRTRCPPISRAMAKRARVDKDSALSGLTRLSEREKTAILERLVNDSRLSARKVVCEELEKRDAKPLDPNLLQSFGSRAYRAFHQLDRLRPSQQCEQSHRVTSDIGDLIQEAGQLKAAHAIMALARVAGVMSHASDTGQVFHDTVASCGGIPYDLAEAMKKQLQLVAATDWGSLKAAYEQMLRVQSRLQDDFAIEEFDPIVSEMAKHCKS